MQIFDWYTWVILPLVVFLARLIEHSKAFFTVEELRSVQQGIFPVRSSGQQDMFFRRKSK